MLAKPPFSSQRRYASREDWDRHRDIIEDLYLTQGKPRKEVMGILQEKLGFRTTASSFKKNIKRLGLDRKNIRTQDLRIILQDPSTQTVEVRGQVVPISEVRRRLLQNHRLLARVRAGSIELGSSATGLLFSTPAAANLPYAPIHSPPELNPSELRVTDEFARAFSELTFASASLGKWVVQDGLFLTVPDEGPAVRLFHPFADRWFAADVHLNVGAYPLAFKALGRLFDYFGTFLDTGHPLVLTYLLMMFYTSPSLQAHPEILDRMVRHLADLARLRLGMRHPVCRALSSLRDQPRQTAMLISARVFAAMADAIDSIVGPGSMTGQEVLRNGRLLQSLAEGETSPTAAQLGPALMKLMMRPFLMEKEANELAVVLKRCLPEFFESPERVTGGLAWFETNMANTEDGLRLGREIFTLSVETYGPSHNVSSDMFISLHRKLLIAGMKDEASQLAAQMKERLDAENGDLKREQETWG